MGGAGIARILIGAAYTVGVLIVCSVWGVI
jgi:hypothetical protein